MVGIELHHVDDHPIWMRCQTDEDFPSWNIPPLDHRFEYEPFRLEPERSYDSNAAQGKNLLMSGMREGVHIFIIEGETQVNKKWRSVSHVLIASSTRDFSKFIT